MGEISNHTGVLLKTPQCSRLRLKLTPTFYCGSLVWKIHKTEETKHGERSMLLNILIPTIEAAFLLQD